MEPAPKLLTTIDHKPLRVTAWCLNRRGHLTLVATMPSGWSLAGVEHGGPTGVFLDVFGTELFRIAPAALIEVRQAAAEQAKQAARILAEEQRASARRRRRP